MDYIKEMNAFYDSDIANQLTPNATLLYFALLNIANKLYWKADFVVSNLRLQSLAGIQDRKTFDRARNQLIQKGLIDYKSSGKANQAGTYTIIGCVAKIQNNATQNNSDSQNDGKNATQNATQDGTQSATQNATQDDHINKQNKTKQNKTKNNNIYMPAKINYAEYVSMTNDEYQNLLVAYGEENTKRMIEVLDNYKGATGKKYKSDYRAMLNWVVDKVMREEKGGNPIVNIARDNKQDTRKYTFDKSKFLYNGDTNAGI